MIRNYNGLSLLDSLEDRFNYLKIGQRVGKETFGYDRYLNQGFYHSSEWKHIRDEVIVRDNGCELGLDGYEIPGRILIHHMNPVQMEQLVHFDGDVLDPMYLVCCSHKVHNAIHYGNDDILPRRVTERRPHDTSPWRT